MDIEKDKITSEGLIIYLNIKYSFLYILCK